MNYKEQLYCFLKAYLNDQINDDEEKKLLDSIESQLYEVREQDLLVAMKIVSSHINPLGGN